MPDTMKEKILLREDLFGKDAEGQALLASKCTSCGQVFFPKIVFCLSCLSDSVKDITLSRRGKLNTYTIGHMASMHFQPPYAIGYLDMPENVMVFAPLKMIEGKPFKIGMEMELVIEKLWEKDNKEIIGYSFKPV
jgi:uncharacterized OB-fold protein